jgi:AcrR family transcriptional regulator
MPVKEAEARRAADVEQAILEAARDILAVGGLDALSMRLVAERVGVSATAIYHYFENKDQLVRRVVEYGFQRFGAYLEEAAARHPKGSLERVRSLGEAYLQFALENQSYFRVLFSLHHGDPHRLDELPDGGGYGLLRRAVEEAMDAGAIRRANPDVMVMYLWSMTHGLLTISMACRIDSCPEFSADSLELSPLELFHAFDPYVREGISDGGEEGGGP